MINLPVEPVIFQRENLLQLFPGEWTADRFAAEIPRGRRLVGKLNRRGPRLNVKFQRAPIDRALKGADGFVVVAQHDKYGRYAADGAEAPCDLLYIDTVIGNA